MCLSRVRGYRCQDYYFNDREVMKAWPSLVSVGLERSNEYIYIFLMKERESRDKYLNVSRQYRMKV